MSSEIFPFELVLEEDDHKELFVKTVESVLVENLQCENSFGCKILDCHTHVGSKKHLPVFVESELLFHNSYYNKGFAFCTAKLLCEKVKQYKKVFLIGYETFGELYICETVEVLKKSLGKSVEYCIAETVGDEFRIRASVDVSYLDNETYFAFIVPINTTLTTHDKLLHKFSDWCEKRNRCVEFTDHNCINLALVVIAPTNEKNDYWEVISKQNRILQLKESKQSELIRLKNKSVYYFAWVEGEWYNSEECTCCFPDLDNRSLKEEHALFEVNRASVVPMLQLGIESVQEPLLLQSRDREIKNIAKLFVLNQFLLHQHTVRNGNHYQYYFDTQRFFQAARKIKSDLGLESWLETEVRNSIQSKNKEENPERILYNFIVAPRHYSNAGFVQCVNDIVFGGTARILYLDVNKEYRGNVKAKYSDLTRLVDNIINSKQPSKLCFHYVDDMIFSGSNFLQTKNLLNTLIASNKDDKLWSKSLFESIIILVGRNSKDSKAWFVGNADNFYEYVHLSVSPMRNHEDACTLCKMVDSSKKIKGICATNEMANTMENTIKRHLQKEVEELDGTNAETGKNLTTNEKRARVLIRHMLMERLSNRWWLSNEKKVVNRESKEDIFEVIQYFYENLGGEFKKNAYKNYFSNELMGVNCYSEDDFRIALIKVISRPFFCYHIRQKQAALKFCLETLDTILNKNVQDITAEEGIIIRPLVNALADLNSIYLVRAEVMNKIMGIIKDDDKKKYLSTLEYCTAIKKVISMSSDDSKSLLLEHILVKGEERMFFKKQDRLLGGKLTECSTEIKQTLYLENNSVLAEGFQEIISNSLECKSANEIPYYLEKYYEIVKLNLGNKEEEFPKLVEIYKSMHHQLKTDKPNRDCLKAIAVGAKELFGNADAKMFFRSKSEEIVYDGYYLLNDEKDIAFYSRDNLKTIEDTLHFEPILDTVYVGAQMCIVKISEEDVGEIYFSFINSGAELDENWFKVKILLTLRNEFVQMMKRLNIVNEMNKLDVERKEKALEIRKAHSHYSYEYFEGRKEFELRCIPENADEGAEIAKTTRKRLYDNYWLMLSNDFVSDLYRKGIYYSQDIPYKGVRLGERLTECLEASGFQKEGEYWSYEIVTPNKKREGDITVKIKCKVNDFKDKKFWYFGRGEKLVPYYYYLILSFAANAGFHYLGEENSVCELQVMAEGEYIVFKNNISDGPLEDTTLEALRKAAHKKLNVPPWEFESSEQSITLWSFFRYFEMMDKRYENLSQSERGRKSPRNSTKGNGICILVEDNCFIVKLQMLEHVERRDIYE